MQQGNLPVLYCEPPAVEKSFRPTSPNLTLRTNCQIKGIKFSRIGRQLGLLNNKVSLWNLAKRKLMRSLQISGYVSINELAYSPNNCEIAFGDDQYEISIWNSITGLCKHGHQNDLDKSDYSQASYRVQTLDYSPCGKQIVIGNADGVITLWDSLMCTELDIYNQEHCAAVICVRFSPNGQSIVSGSADETIQILDATTLQQKLNIKCRNFCSQYSFVSYVGYSLDNKDIISVIEGAIKIWDAETGRARIFRKDHKKSIYQFALSQNDKYMLYQGQNFFGICDCQSRSVLGEIQIKSLITSSIYSRDNSQIALSCLDGVCRFYRTDRI